MPSDLNIVITVGARDARRDAYAVQLLHEGKPLADIWVQIDRQALLEDEHKFSARDYGVRLYNALFTGALGREYQRLIGRAGTGAAIRVQLVIHADAPELHALSWERLFHAFGDGETPLAADARSPFSRFLVSGLGDQPPVKEHPLRLLVAIANPTGLPEGCSPLDVTGEADSLARALADFSGRVQVTLLGGRTLLPDALRQRLAGQGWTLCDGVTSWEAIQRWLPGHHLLHILAHGQFKASEPPGKGTAYLLLEGEGSDRVARGALDRVPDDDIAIGLAGVHPQPQLIFLAACDSARRPKEGTVVIGATPFVGLAPKLIEARVPAVIAMQDVVPVELARTLAADFYRRLFDHGQVDRALNEARSLLYERDRFEWAIPALFLRLRDGQLLTPIEPSKAFEPEMVFVRGGPFVMGSPPGEDAVAGPWKQHEVALPAYWIGKYPVTNAQYAEFAAQEPARRPDLIAGWTFIQPPRDKLDHPVVGVSWHDARAYCQWLSEETGRKYRLPTEAEWEKAARGDRDSRIYPWGDELTAERCNYNGSQITPVDRYDNGRSPYGCYDMVGNVREWTSTLWGSDWSQPQFEYPYQRDEREPDEQQRSITLHTASASFHICRGGAYDDQTDKLWCSARDYRPTKAREGNLGFRAVREPVGVERSA